jgi:hypothetical protein
MGGGGRDPHCGSGMRKRRDSNGQDGQSQQGREEEIVSSHEYLILCDVFEGKVC